MVKLVLVSIVAMIFVLTSSAMAKPKFINKNGRDANRVNLKDQAAQKRAADANSPKAGKRERKENKVKDANSAGTSKDRFAKQGQKIEEKAQRTAEQETKRVTALQKKRDEALAKGDTAKVEQIDAQIAKTKERAEKKQQRIGDKREKFQEKAADANAR